MDQSNVLDMEFIWRGWRGTLTDPNHPSQPAYKIDLTLANTMEFETADGRVFGSSRVKFVSINPSFTVHSHRGTLQAMKRLATKYNYFSYARAQEINSDSPVPMIWTSSFAFKTWQFTCLDENLLPVARVKANVWALKALGTIEFLGDSMSQDLREEIIVTGITLYLCMGYIISSPLSLLGAAVSKTGPIEQPPAVQS